VVDARVVAGVDGCRRGWVLVEGRVDGRDTPRVSVARSLADLVARVDRGEVASVAIDIPIGLPERGARRCDVEARKRLGPRRHSVFPAPVRAVLGSPTWESAGAQARITDGRGLSRQVFNLLPKIAEVDRLLSPAHQERIVESHPELSFAAIAGAPLATTKRNAAGRRARAQLIGVEPVVLPGAGPDDVLDAHALLWTARRVARGDAERLGGEHDARGLRMEIVY
jgi:predicted RNase H-like nuclease